MQLREDSSLSMKASEEKIEILTDDEDNIVKKYIEEKESKKRDGEQRETEKKEAAKQLRQIMQRKIRKGYKPSKAIKELLSHWIEQCNIMERPTVFKLTKENNLSSFHPGPIPEQGYYDKTHYEVAAIKWKTKKEKYLGSYLESPVDIETGKVKKCKYYKKLSITGLCDEDKPTTLCNAGGLVKGTINGEVYLSEGPLFGIYKFEDFSLKFGSTNNNGTEHAINGQRFALEFHMNFVATNCEGCPPRVIKTRSNRAILVVIFEESNRPHNFEFFSLFRHLTKVGKKITLTNNVLYDFKDVLLSSEYYNYTGSSTEKPYTPNVEWIIFKKPQPINKTQLELLWQLKKNGNLKPTIRPIQPTGKREVFEPSYKYHDECRRKPICECYKWPSPEALPSEKNK